MPKMVFEIHLDKLSYEDGDELVLGPLPSGSVIEWAGPFSLYSYGIVVDFPEESRLPETKLLKS